jgi:hypothetical protein
VEESVHYKQYTENNAAPNNNITPAKHYFLNLIANTDSSVKS